MTQKPHIGLLDCNNFFVSCERLFRPDLEGVPVVVLSSNDGCVVARSQEVKDIGILMGVPYFKIKDIIAEHGVQIFSGHLALYRDVSRRVFEVLRECVDTVEQYSVDEAFFHISPDSDVNAAIAEIKQTVESKVGIPVSIGVGRSKTLAKHASERAKKTNGLWVSTEEYWRTESAGITLESIWGVGAGLALKFRSHGLSTVQDLMVVPSERVSAIFGLVGARLQAELQGIQTTDLSAKRPLQKSLMSTRSFSKTAQNKTVLADALAYHARHIAADLRAMDAVASTMRVSIKTSRYSDFFLRGGSKEVVFTTPTNDTFSLLEQAKIALEALFEPGVPYQKVGVVVSGIQAAGSCSESLFSNDAVDNADLLAAMDTLNTHAGKELVTIGSRLHTPSWQAKSTMRSPAYTTRWSDLATVSA